MDASPRLVPSWWVLAGLTLLFAFKVLYVDPHTLWFRCVSSPVQVCGAQETANVIFESAPTFRGFTVETYEVARGDTLYLRLYWEGKEGITPRLSSFVHLRNDAEGIPAQADHADPGGLLTDAYHPGRLYADEFFIPIPREMAAGEYLLEVGWYNAAAGEQVDPQQATIEPPLGYLWRSVLLPTVTVR